MADIITYPLQGITYDADDAAGYFATRQSGVYSAEEDFAVTPADGLTVTVSSGHAWVHPSRWVGYSIIMQQPAILPLTDPDPVRSRIDRVVLRYDAASRKTSLLVLEGVPDSAGPVAPAITRTELIYDLCIAEIVRTAGSTAVSVADIYDTRADEAVCGLMRDGVTGIPTSELLAQWQAVQAQESAAVQVLLEQLRSAIAQVDSGSFYTKAEADAHFTLTPDSLNAALGYSLADKLKLLERMMNMDGKLVYTATVNAGNTARTLTVPDTVDYIVVKMAGTLGSTTVSSGSVVSVGAAADFGATRIARGGKAIAMVGGPAVAETDGVTCAGTTMAAVTFAQGGTVTIGNTDSKRNTLYPCNVEGYQYLV